MSFEKISPNWQAEGVEPPDSLKTQGFVAGYKPPAAYFNWLFTRISDCIVELQEETENIYATSIGKSGTGTNSEIFNNYTYNAASGNYAHAQNYVASASGAYSHAGGYYGIARGVASIAHGYRVTADDYQTVFGKYNTSATPPTGYSDTTGSIFIVGCGTDQGNANALRITAAGQCMGTTYFASSGADYSEYFEWADGNPNNEDRRGLFVTLEGEKIRVANADDDYILGVVSATPMVIGDIQSEEWHDRFVKDVFGERLTEVVEVPETTDEETGEVVPAHTETRFILNPEYNPKKEYKGRNERKEWTTVGLLGKLIVVDDGSCEINGYCKVSDNGTATKSTEKTDYRVLSRIDKTHVKILLK